MYLSSGANYSVLLARQEVSRLHRIVGQVEADNVAAQHCVVTAGFMQQGCEPEEESFLILVCIPTGAAG